MSSLLNETVWLHIKQHPGITVVELENYLNNRHLSKIVRDLYNCRMLDREEKHRPVAMTGFGATGHRTVRYFTYTAVGHEYDARKLRKSTKPGPKAKRLPEPKLVAPSLPPVAPSTSAVWTAKAKQAPSVADQLRAQLAPVPLKDEIDTLAVFRGWALPNVKLVYVELKKIFEGTPA